MGLKGMPNISLELAEKEEKPPQMLEVERKSRGPMETNIDPTRGRINRWTN